MLNAVPPTTEILFGEACFLATSHSWAHSFQQSNPAYACLGYVYDDIAHYFMADYPNRLIQKLNSDETPSAQELARAETLLARIVSQRISKYNAQPMVAPAMTDGYKRRVLVCDQAYADASTVYGKVGDAEFEQMLLAAITENPDAEILVKTHPDTVWEKDKRTGYYAHLQSTGRVRMLRDPINPYMLFDLVDTVYVGTSQMGLEALFAGKKVVTFGAPFYAGWGLTDDRQEIPHRHRTRSLTELFHYFYIWYTIYHLPERKGPAEIEDVLSYIEKNRPYTLPPSKEELAAPPKVSIIIPVYGVEKYVEECIASVQRQTLREIEIIPINDASPDGSQAIIDRLAAEDPRIRPIILSENIGQGFARNRGLEAARGEYIWFIDSDDIMPDRDFLRQITEKADAECLDMTRGRKGQFRDDGKSIFSEDKIEPDSLEGYFPSSKITDENFLNDHCFYSWHFCLWLYRRKFIKDNRIKFILTQMEDRVFAVQALAHAKKIGAVDSYGLVYRMRAHSTMRREKSLTDLERFTLNFEASFDAIKARGDRDPHFRRHFPLLATQYIHAFFMGWPFQVIQRQIELKDHVKVYERVAAKLIQIDFKFTDIVREWRVLSTPHIRSGAYELLISALRARRFHWIETAVMQQPVPQERLYAEMLDEPKDQEGRDFQAALSVYARNERVTTAVAPPVEASALVKPRIVIHIGATKTGSTFIQHMLEENRPALLREGIWFPEIGLFWQQTRPRKQAGHSHFTPAAVRREPGPREHLQRGLELMEGRVHTIILSSEAFFLQQNAHFLANYFAGHPVEMVVYLRRQDDWANSQYCEFVSGGAVGRVDMPMPEWLEQPDTQRFLDYRGLLDKWAEKIGRENIHVRVFDRSAFAGGDLLSDFAQTTGLPQLLDLPRPDESQQNDARLSAAHVEILRLFNKRPFASRDAYFDFIEEVGVAVTQWRQENDLPMPKPWVLEPARADALMEKYGEMNAAIARDYLGRPDGVLFGPGQAAPASTAIYPEEMALIEQIYQRHAGEAEPVAQTTPSNPAQQQRIKKLEKELATLAARIPEKERVVRQADAMINDLEAERDMLRKRLASNASQLEQLKRSRWHRLGGKLRGIRAALSQRPPA